MEIKNVVTTGLMPDCGFDYIIFSQVWPYYAVRNDGDVTIGIDSRSRQDEHDTHPDSFYTLWLEPGETGIVETDRDFAVIYAVEQGDEMRCTVTGQSDKIIPWQSAGGKDGGDLVYPVAFTPLKIINSALIDFDVITAIVA